MDQTMDLTQRLKALAEPTRLRLVALLTRHELNVGELVRVLGVSQSRISNHLKLLAAAGLVRPRRDGQWVYYRAVDEPPAGPLLAAVVPLAEAEAPVATDREAAIQVMQERTRASRSFFEAHAPDWPQLCRELLGEVDLARAVAERLPAGCARAADLGCGTGEMLPVLARGLGGAGRVIGVDHTPAMLEQARRRFAADPELGPRIELRMGELEHLPMADREVDCALLSLVLHHLADPRAGLAEAARVLAPGGHLLVLDFAAHGREDLRTRHGDRWLGFDAPGLRAWLERAGFSIDTEERLPLAGGSPEFGPELALLAVRATRTATAQGVAP